MMKKKRLGRKEDTPPLSCSDNICRSAKSAESLVVSQANEATISSKDLQDNFDSYLTPLLSTLKKTTAAKSSIESINLNLGEGVPTLNTLVQDTSPAIQRMRSHLHLTHYHLVSKPLPCNPSTFASLLPAVPTMDTLFSSLDLTSDIYAMSVRVASTCGGASTAYAHTAPAYRASQSADGSMSHTSPRTHTVADDSRRQRSYPGDPGREEPGQEVEDTCDTQTSTDEGNKLGGADASGDFENMRVVGGEGVALAERDMQSSEAACGSQV